LDILLFWALVTPILGSVSDLGQLGRACAVMSVIGLALGFFFYRLLLSSLVISFLLWLVDLIRRLLNLLVTGAVWLGSLPVQVYQEVRFHYAHRAQALASPRRLWRIRPKLRWRK
jgi:hypothetical protein